MRSRLSIGLCAWIAAAALTAAGCGGGGSGGRLSQAEFEQLANAICAKYDRQIEALGEPASAAELSQFVENAIPIIERGVAELRAVEPPEESEEKYNRMIDGVEDSIPVVRRLADAAEREDQEAIQDALAEGDRIDAESDRLATELGLGNCAGDDEEGS